jgi:peptidoglycan/xylan/chitin deacetylase (PgdA/CDA1 family)
MISDDEVKHIKHLYRYKDIQQFKKDLEFLLVNYVPITLTDLIKIVKSGGLLPEKAFVLTFDDGFREMSDIVAPILLEKGISATFFINTAFIDNQDMCYQHKASILVEYFQKNTFSPKIMQKVGEIFHKSGLLSFNEKKLLAVNYHERQILDEVAEIIDYDFNDYLLKKKPYLISNQIQELLNQGFTIGAHSINHPLYSSVPLEEQIYQTSQSVRSIKERFGLTYGAFAFPHTDNGVSKQFFIEIYKDGLVDVSFGTGGIMEDIFHRNIQRINFEKPMMPAKNILSFHFARRFYKNFIGKGRLTRLCI